MSITSTIDQVNELTIFTVKDNPTFDEFIIEIKAFYEGEPTRNTLWILTPGTLWDLSGHHIEKMAHFAPRFDKKRSGAKTAIVAPDEVTKALTQLFVLFGSSKKLPFKVRIFETTELAMQWINGGC